MKTEPPQAVTDLGDLPARLRSLNNAQRGSLGEHLFSSVARSKLRVNVVPTRRDRADFIVDGTKVDVKTTIRNLDTPLRPLKPYRGHRTENIKYAQVEFVPEGARVSLELEVLAMLNWLDVAVSWSAWAQTVRVHPTTAVQIKNIGPLRQRIVEHFRTLGFRTRVIYRTIQAEFRDESPANLLPSQQRPNGLTVYLDFASSRLEEDNLRRVIAFPDVAVGSLVLLEKTRLHKQKVDLTHIPPRFVFASLSELFAESTRITK